MTDTGIKLDVDVTGAVEKLAAVGKLFRPDILSKLMGETLLFWINENFRQRGALFGGWANLRPNTLANPLRGGAGSQPLRSTGKLAQSFTRGREGNIYIEGTAAVTVGTSVSYAPFHQFGTRPYPIVPVQRKVLFFWTVGGNAAPYMNKGNTFARRVEHPGLPPRHLLPPETLAREYVLKALQVYVDKQVASAR